MIGQSNKTLLDNYVLDVNAKWIKGYEKRYAVTNDGKVISFAQTKPHYVRPFNNRGYLEVTLTKDNTKKAYRIHRLVAIAFIPNPDNLATVDHIDFNRANNNVSNLRWMSLSDNVSDGRKHYFSQYDPSKRFKCLENGKIYNRYVEAAQDLNIRDNNIHACCKGTRNKTYGYHFKYVEGAEALC